MEGLDLHYSSCHVTFRKERGEKEILGLLGEKLRMLNHVKCIQATAYSVVPLSICLEKYVGGKQPGQGICLLLFVSTVNSQIVLRRKLRG